MPIRYRAIGSSASGTRRGRYEDDDGHAPRPQRIHGRGHNATPAGRPSRREGVPSHDALGRWTAGSGHVGRRLTTGTRNGRGEGRDGAGRTRRAIARSTTASVTPSSSTSRLTSPWGPGCGHASLLTSQCRRNPFRRRSAVVIFGVGTDMNFMSVVYMLGMVMNMPGLDFEYGIGRGLCHERCG